MTPPAVLKSVGILRAVFPTTRGRLTDEVVRIDPGSSYNVMWVMDPDQPQFVANQNGGRSEFEAILDFLSFKPGTYTLAMTLHVWHAPPASESGCVVNVSDSHVLGTTADVDFGVPIGTLLIGASLGSVMGFILMGLVEYRKSEDELPSSVRNEVGHRSLARRLGAAASAPLRFLAGVLVSVLLALIGTVLLARLAGSDFLVTVSINDIWGSMATGFVIQVGGLRYLVKLAGGEGTETLPWHERTVSRANA